MLLLSRYSVSGAFGLLRELFKVVMKYLYSEQELKPFLDFWKTYKPYWDYGICTVDELYEDSYISDGSQGYPKGTRLFDLEIEMASVVDLFFKIKGL